MTSFLHTTARPDGLAASPAVPRPSAVRLPHWLRALDAWMAQPRSARAVIVGLAVYLLVAANWPLWLALARIGGAPSVYMRSIGAMAVLTVLGTVAMLSLTAWTRWMKPLWFAVVLIAALAQHYMLTYRVVMDPSMAANAFQTDLHEARDLMGWRLLFDVLIVVALPAWWLLRVRVQPMRLWSQLWRNVALLAAALAVAVAGGAAMSRELAPLMRNHVTLRYMMNPIAGLYSASAVVIKPLFLHRRQLIPISGGAALGVSYAAQARPPLFVVVVGETARADHFALNGYARDTTPGLAGRGVTSWRNVHSCGTNTLASVPCMFSSLGKVGYEGSKDDHENLLDVAQAAGLAVLWIENQSGCKGVCDGTGIEHTQASDAPALCEGDRCLDDILLTGLRERIDATPGDLMIVLHQLGNHGPNYFERYPAAYETFKPACHTAELSRCTPAQIANAYDNAIGYTDAFLARALDLVQQQQGHDAALLYVSDHGESLGEYGLYLHGAPYAIAPSQQLHVPMIAWVSSGLAADLDLDMRCLRARADVPLSHDNLFHSVLGVFGVRTRAYAADLDLFAPCRHTSA